MRRTITLGHCGVDSGQIMLIDPCYVFNDNYGEGGPYDECCRITLSDKGAGDTSLGGVVTRTAYGDGCFPVTAEVEDCGDGKTQILRVTIDFT